MAEVMRREELERRAAVALARAVNLAGEELLARAIPRTPFGGDAGGGQAGDLRQSGHISREAQPVDGLIECHVAFNTVYAAAQHEGEMWYLRDRSNLSGPQRASAYVHWVARKYTTPGTGKKYLEGPLKEFSAEYLRFLSKVMRPFFAGGRI